MEPLHDLFEFKERPECPQYKVTPDDGFTCYGFSVGQRFDSDSLETNYVVFLLDGEFEMSRSGFRPAVFRGGEMIVLPREAEFHCEAVKEGRILALRFRHIVSGCDKFILNSYEPYCKTVKYEFKGTIIRYPLTAFLDLLAYSLRNGLYCKNFQIIKEAELFIYLRGFYSFDEIGDLFHPVVGGELSFREMMAAGVKSARTVDDLVEFSHLSYSAFYAKFKREFGITAKEWMLQRRSDDIITKIQNPSTCIKDIIFEYGFPSYSAFNRFCHRQYHCTPTELVNIYRKSGDRLSHPDL